MYKELVRKELAKTLESYGEVDPFCVVIPFRKDNVDVKIYVDVDLDAFERGYTYQLVSKGKVTQGYVKRFPMGQTYKTVNLLVEEVLKHCQYDNG